MRWLGWIGHRASLTESAKGGMHLARFRVPGSGADDGVGAGFDVEADLFEVVGCSRGKAAFDSQLGRARRMDSRGGDGVVNGFTAKDEVGKDLVQSVGYFQTTGRADGEHWG